MKTNSGLIFALSFVSCLPVFCQETSYSPGNQTMIINNPAVTGRELDGILRISYMNFYPGNHYNFHSVFLSYDSFFPVVHGGAGFYMANDYIGGIVRDLRGGLTYSYFIQAGRELFINAGLSAAFFHRGFNFSEAVFPDQIDPMGRISLPSSETLSNENRTLFDVGTGFTFLYRKFTGGLGITHLTQPDLNKNGQPAEKLKRKYLLHFLVNLDLNNRNQIEIIPFTTLELQGKYICSSTGAAFRNNYMSVSSILLADNNKNVDIQAGFSFRWEKLAFFYNYRFNLKSGNSLLPFSIIHQTGLTFNLYKVEKRIKFKTINIPEM